MNNCLYFLNGKESEKLVAEGFYKGIYYCVISRRLYPCCYVAIEQSNPLNGTCYDKIRLECHGGLTFSGNSIQEGISKVADINSENGAWFVGWDYAHKGDFLAGIPSRSHDKEWTLKELLNDIKYAINQVSGNSIIKLYT